MSELKPCDCGDCRPEHRYGPGPMKCLNTGMVAVPKRKKSPREEALEKRVKELEGETRQQKLWIEDARLKNYQLHNTIKLMGNTQTELRTQLAEAYKEIAILKKQE